MRNSLLQDNLKINKLIKITLIISLIFISVSVNGADFDCSQSNSLIDNSSCNLEKKDVLTNNEIVNIESIEMQKGEFIDSCDNDECLCVSDVTYPIIKGLANNTEQIKLNKKLKTVAAQYKCHGKKKLTTDKNNDDALASEYYVSYKILLNSPEILSIFQEAYTYGAGAAHGYSSNYSYIIDKRTGQEILPVDLFGKKISGVNKYIYNKLKNDTEQITSESALEENKNSFIKNNSCNHCVLLIAQDSIKVSFDEYSIGPGSSGNIEVEIPLNYIIIDSLSNFIEKNKEITIKKK